MNNKIVKWLFLILVLISCLFGCAEDSGDIFVGNSTQPEITAGSEQQAADDEQQETETDKKQQDEEAKQKESVVEDGCYDSKEEVALYLSIYKKLPSNYITKKEAKALGWSGGGLDDYAYGKCIGGDYFGNYEENLPIKEGRSYYECDIDTLHADSRGAKRMVYSNDGLIYYTENHYETFVLLYGKE